MKIKLKKHTKKKIAVIQYRHDLQSFTKNILECLINNDHEVDLYIDRQSLKGDFVNIKNSKINIIHLNGFNWSYKNIINKIFWKILYEINSVLKKNNFFYSKSDFLKIKNNFLNPNNNYELILAIEKLGLLIAGNLYKEFKIPISYYSLELYLDKNFAFPSYKRIRFLEKKYFRNCSQLIIQDKERGEILCKNNLFKAKNTIYLPVSVNKPSIEGPKKSSFWHEKFNINKDTKIIFYFGRIYQKNRGIEDLIEGFKNKKNIAVVIHGWADSKLFLNYLKFKSRNSNIYFSINKVKQEEISKLFISADITAIWYTNDDLNNKCTTFSSEKMAFSLSCGVPVLTNHNEYYLNLFSKYKCGESIKSLKNSYNLSQKIISDYKNYQKDAFNAFNEYYDLDKNLEEFSVQFGKFLK